MLIRSHQQLPQQQQINLTLQQQQQQQQQQITGMDVGYSGDVIQHQYLPSNSWYAHDNNWTFKQEVS